MIWKTIPGCSWYECSACGDVRRSVWVLSRPPGPIANGPGTNGYHKVCLIDDTGAKKYFNVHRLVAMLFLPPPATPNHRDVAHRDGNRSNNHVSNLRWSTHGENMADREDHGRTVRGSASPRAVLVEADVLEIRSSRETACKAAARFGVSVGTIYAVRQRKTWRHVR